MGQLTPQLTSNGTEMMLKALQGNGITFTKIVIGDGTGPSEPANAVGLNHERISIPLIDISRQANYVLLTGRYDNGNVSSGFHIKELGVYGFNVSDREEKLYAYRYSETDVDFVPAIDSGRTVDTELSVIVAVGTAKNIAAAISTGTGYVNVADFNSHVNANNNPHNVTKEQLGLGNVENKSVSEQKPTWTARTTLDNLAPGDTFAVVISKVGQAIEQLKKHLQASNPHSITPQKIKAATESHTHSANDITSGILPATRGGTGCKSLQELKDFVAQNSGEVDLSNIKIKIGNKLYPLSEEIDISDAVGEMPFEVLPNNEISWTAEGYIDNQTGEFVKNTKGDNYYRTARIPVAYGQEYKLSLWASMCRVSFGVYDAQNNLLSWETPSYMAYNTSCHWWTFNVVIPPKGSYIIIMDFALLAKQTDAPVIQRRNINV